MGQDARGDDTANDGTANDDTAQRHIPVLLDRCLDLLAPAFDVADPATAPVMIDATLGMGGHTEGALRRFPRLHVVGIDRDPEAIERATRRLAEFGDRFTAVHATYDDIGDVARDHATRPDGLVDGVLMDLGVSSLQLDEAERGFSYAQDAPLDMRMDPTSGQSAADLLATADVNEITRILRTYGEEKFARRIAQRIVRDREAGRPLTRTAQLADVVRESIPAPARRTGGNPSKRTFQALRVAVNDELRILEDAVPAALRALRVGGRIVIESYQSLEDRIVKGIFVEGSRDTTPPDLPVIPTGEEAPLRLLTRGAEKADAEEIEHNTRSASVRLRAAEIRTPWRTRP